MNTPWVLSHLREAHEELTRTIVRLDSDQTIGETEFEIALAHMYNHLNTAWNSRAATDQEIAAQSNEEFYAWREYPADIPMKPNQPSPDVELLRTAYTAFNARDIDAALATMAPDVAWPKAFKGGLARGHQEVRAYWTEQWAEIDPHVEPSGFRPEGAGRILVDVHQVVRDLAGAVIADGHVGHMFTIESGLIRAMEVCPLPPDQGG